MIMKNLMVGSFIMMLLFSSVPGKAQPCTLTVPSNIVVKSDNGKEGAMVSFPVAADLGIGNCGTISYSPASGSFFRIGSHSIIVTTSLKQKSFFTLTVTDNEPPELSHVTLSSRQLSPVKNKMQKVAVYYTASDNAEEVNTILTVRSNDTESAIRDWEIIDNHMVSLKTSSLANGSPRIFTITVSCSDVAGNTTTRTTTLTISGPFDSLSVVKE
jgi:hypothetical protein